MKQANKLDVLSEFIKAYSGSDLKIPTLEEKPKGIKDDERIRIWGMGEGCFKIFYQKELDDVYMTMKEMEEKNQNYIIFKTQDRAKFKKYADIKSIINKKVEVGFEDLQKELQILNNRVQILEKTILETLQIIAENTKPKKRKSFWKKILG